MKVDTATAHQKPVSRIYPYRASFSGPNARTDVNAPLFPESQAEKLNRRR